MSSPRIYVPLGVPFPPQRRKKVIVFRPKVGERFKLLIVNSRPLGVLTHWDGKRSREHREPATECPWCRARKVPIWTSFIGVWSLYGRAYGLAEITRDAAEAYEPFHPDSKVNLRGKTLTLWRNGMAYNSPIRGELSSGRESQYLPEPLWIARALETLWELPDNTLEYVGGEEGVIPREGDELPEDPEVQGL